MHARATAEIEESAYPYNNHMDEVDSAIAKLVTNLAAVNAKAADHARQVSSWSARLARRLALSEREATFVTRCALLHDIGDLEVGPMPTAGPEHVVAGERMAQGNVHLAPFAQVIRAHHEALDGSGFPDGLRGDDIPRAAQIISVADAFNDLVAGHGGRKPLTAAAAVAELTAACGSRYDITVVAALHTLIHSR
jgi:HD-GYP domain-containing protein (c-di-GMP phosphodiesterase class II)